MTNKQKNSDSYKIVDPYIIDAVGVEKKKTEYPLEKKEEGHSIYWVNFLGERFGEHIFTFDKKKFYNLFRDYPHNLTKEEKEIFDRENPFWKDFFKNRSKE